MGDYLDKNKPMGPNVKRLLPHFMARVAVPPGGGMAAAIKSMSSTEQLTQTLRRGMALLEQALQEVKNAPDNPYGDDDEAIAAKFLELLNSKDGK